MPSIPFSVLDPTAPTVGVQTCSPYGANGITPASQDMRIGYFKNRKAMTVSQATVATGSPAAATVTLIRFGLYSVASTGALTLIASTPNDTALFAATTTEYTKAFSASVALAADTWYAFVVLQVATTTAQIAGMNCAAAAIAGTGTRPRLAARFASQSDLPSTIANASLALSGQIPYALLS